MDIDLADIVIHIDQTLDEAGIQTMEAAFRNREGVVSVRFNDDNPHLVVIEYNPAVISSRDLIDIPRFHGLTGELVGL